MTDEKVVFAHTMEGLFLRGLGGELTPVLRAELKASGVDLDKPLLPAYPMKTWNRALELGASHMYPHTSLPAAVRTLGERMIGGYNETLIGKAVLAMARLIGPRRAALRSQKNWRSGNNYSEVTCLELAPSDFRLTFNEEGTARWCTEGLLAAGLTYAGARELVVRIESFTETHAVYAVTWSA